MTDRYVRIDHILAIPDMETRVRDLARYVLRWRVSDPDQWLEDHHALLSGMTPNEAVADGRGAEVIRILLNVEFSGPP